MATAPVPNPTRTPTRSPSETPNPDRFFQPGELCPNQRRDAGDGARPHRP
jgi:hypothetical protein